MSTEKESNVKGDYYQIRLSNTAEATILLTQQKNVQTEVHLAKFFHFCEAEFSPNAFPMCVIAVRYRFFPQEIEEGLLWRQLRLLQFAPVVHVAVEKNNENHHFAQ